LINESVILQNIPEYFSLKFIEPLFIYILTYKKRIMPPGRPRKLNSYEQVKVRKLRKILSDHNIHTFDKINDSTLSQTVHIDSTGRIFISHDFYDSSLKKIERTVKEYITT